MVREAYVDRLSVLHQGGTVREWGGCLAADGPACPAHPKVCTLHEKRVRCDRRVILVKSSGIQARQSSKCGGYTMTQPMIMSLARV